MVRILHVSEVSWGGVVSLIRQFADEQTLRGHTVGLLSPEITPVVGNAITMPWSIVRSRPRTFATALRELKAAIDDFKPDVVHLHSFMAGFVGRTPGVLRGVPVVYQPHSWSFDLRDDAGFRAALRTWERLAGRRTDVLVTNCNDEIDEGVAAGVRTQGVAIGVAVDTQHFTEVGAARQSDLRQEFGLGSQHILVCLGRIARQKGQDLLVQEWERNPLPDTVLVLVGPGDTTALATMAPTQWGTTIKAVGEQDAQPWLSSADLVVLSSRYEGTPVVVAEALSVGTPVVTTNVNGVKELVVGGSLPAAGHVVDLGDMRGLLGTASQLLGDPQRRAQMSSAARQRAETMFAPTAVVDRLQGAYRRAMSNEVPVQRRGQPVRPGA